MTTKSETLRKLICCAFDGAAPDDLDLSLYACLGFYAELRQAETQPSTHTARASDDDDNGAS